MGSSNMGVLQTTVGELVTVKEHQPRAYTVMPIVWCIGYVLTHRTRPLQRYEAC